MKLLEMEVYSEGSNCAIVRPSGRRFPGSVVQGDSLSILCDEARDISQRLKSLEVADEELLWMAQGHQENLLNRLLHYQSVLVAHGIELPYSRAASDLDLVMLISDDEDKS